MNKLLLPIALLCLVVAASCAKDAPSTTGEDAQEYLTKWMDKNHDGVLPNEDGLYILDETVGTGAVRNPELPYVSVRYTVRSLDGTVMATTEEAMAQQLGSYVAANFYGPRYKYIGEYSSYAGEDALLKGMKLGGTRKAVVPAWLLTTSRYDTQQEYISHCSTSTHLIYEYTLVDQCAEDANLGGPLDCIQNLQNFVNVTYGLTKDDSVSYVSDTDPDGSFFFISDTSGFAEEDKFASSATVKINYTGKLVYWDGTAFTTPVFDTTIEKNTDARIHDDARDYSPQSVSMASSYSEITMGDSSSLISGFKGALSLMHWKGQKATAVFSSHHGYGSAGSGSIIPAYAILLFELEILPDE